MIQYSTEFPVAGGKSAREALTLGLEWVTSSRFTQITPAHLKPIPTDSEYEVSIGSERLVVGATDISDFSICGLRWETLDHNTNLQWITTIVSKSTSERNLLGLQVFCEALGAVKHLPAPKKPVFIRLALEKLGGGMDGSVPVTDRPFFLSEGEEPIAAALILGTGGNRLPIVYVSANSQGEHIVDPRTLAKQISGLAHVVVEPSRAFSFSLRHVVNARNVYGGTVGIYWPESDARRSYYLDGSGQSADELVTDILNDIRVALANRRLTYDCSWSHLKESIASRKLERLRQDGSTEIDRYIEAFDSELSAKQRRIDEATIELERLKSELSALRSRPEGSASGLLSPGSEQDLYQGEIKWIVVEALRESIRHFRDDSRRHHVVRDLVESNVVKSDRDRIDNEIRMLFKADGGLDSRSRTALARLGFDISDEGKHYKAVFQGDGRYTFTISKSSSDHRAGKNLASEIRNKLL